MQSWIARDYKLKGVLLEAEESIPEEALREAIINALIHRKYSIPGAIKIYIYENHIDIINPGGFPGLVDLHNLGDGTSFLRNPHLARLAHRTKLIEKIGSGVRLIFDSCEKMGLKPPTYYEGNDIVKLTFYLEKIQSTIEMRFGKSQEEIILSLIKTQRTISVQDVMQALHISRNTATRKLSKLIDQRKIVREGKGPSTRYKMV